MKIEKIINDVIADYSRDNGTSLNCRRISKTLCNSIKAFKEDIEAGEVYALCMGCLYYLGKHGVLAGDIDENEIQLLTKEFPLQNLEDILAKSEPYKWVPAALKKVLQLGNTIFEEAKDAYFMSGFGIQSRDVDSLFSQMLNAKAELDSLNYVYRSYNEVLDIYEQELSESQLDIDTIKGNKSLISFRLAEYIENSGIGVTKEEVDFSVENPFSMPNDLFETTEMNSNTSTN